MYDISAKAPIEAVAVFCTSGNATVTDSTGKYYIIVNTKDSIWFSMIGKTTMKYPVDTIQNPMNFDIMIHVKVHDLPEVKVRNSYYRYDSLTNRKEYAKVFNFKKPSLKLSTSPTYNTTPGVTVGVDLDEIINMFRFKRNRQMLALQNRLLQQEQDKYVDYRFKKSLVIKLTGLRGTELENFMQRYRPEYEWLQLMNEIELGYYIQKCFEAYKLNLPNPYKLSYKKVVEEEDN